MNPPEKILSLDEIIRTKREVGHLKNQLDILELKQTDLANLKLLISTRIGEHKTFQNFARWKFSKILWKCRFYFELEGLASKKTKETIEYKTARNRLTIVKAWVCTLWRHDSSDNVREFQPVKRPSWNIQKKLSPIWKQKFWKMKNQLKRVNQKIRWNAVIF